MPGSKLLRLGSIYGSNGGLDFSTHQFITVCFFDDCLNYIFGKKGAIVGSCLPFFAELFFWGRFSGGFSAWIRMPLKGASLIIQIIKSSGIVE